MRRFVLLLFMIGLFTLLPASVHAATITIVITPDNYTSFPDIFFERIGSASTFAETSPTPTLGDGGFFHNVTSGGDYVRISHLLATPIPLATAIFTYETFINALSATTETFYLNLYIGTPATFGAPTPFCTHRLDFVPNSVVGSWTLHDAMNPAATYSVNDAPGCFGGTFNSVMTLATFLAANPTSLIGGFALQAGDTVSAMVGFQGYLDNVTFGTAGNTITWDFEPIPTSVTIPLTPVIPTGCDINTDPSIIVSPLPNTTFCRVLVRDGVFIGNPGSIPQNLLDAGVMTAVEIYRFDEFANSIQTFPNYQYFCFKGEGRFIYLDSRQAPRQQVEIQAIIQYGFTCGWLPAPGTAVIIN